MIPNTEEYRVNKIHIGRGEAPRLDMNCIDPIFSVLGQLYCVTNYNDFIKLIRIIPLTPLT
jgi:hypothetical protein